MRRLDKWAETAFLLADESTQAWPVPRNLRKVILLILDHHLLRCEEGLSWLDRLSPETGHCVICAADFMKRPRCLLEARCVQLYEEMPVPDGWHEAYTHSNADTRPETLGTRCTV